MILSFEKGDVIQLIDGCTGSMVMTSIWGSGQKGGIKGKFPCEYVYVLPTMDKPLPKIIVSLKTYWILHI